MAQSASYQKMDVRKEEYNAVSGTSYADEKIAGGGPNVISAQPTAVSGVESYVRDLDASQVAVWSAQDVINNFIERIGCGYANEMFLANKISGKALMMLREDHLKEMGIQAIGDRVFLLDMINLLKKKKKELQTTASLWSGETPVSGIAYSKGLWHCMRKTCCPCCASRTYWKVTGQGVFYRKVPPCRENFGTVSTEYMDYRFFKDLELKEKHLCCCFCQRYELELYVDDKDFVGSAKSTEAGPSFPIPHILLHPDAPKVEKIIRNAWSEARLVSE